MRLGGGVRGYPRAPTVLFFLSMVFLWVVVVQWNGAWLKILILSEEEFVTSLASSPFQADCKLHFFN
jgi:hypothetical protein